MNKSNLNKSKLFKRLVILFLAIISVTLFFANRMAKSYGFEGLVDFISNYNANRSLAASYEPQQVSILIKDADYDYLANKREEALDRGIQINIGENYVPCEIALSGDTVVGELRLKGHMTDHLQGEKWSFRVKTTDEFMGMYRFSLQHPGTRHYVNEWLYHELLKEEEIIHLYYDFIHLQLNEKDLGIYAVEEHFGQHVLAHNNRTGGAIIRWNPELYWEGRIDEYQEQYLDQQYAHYYNSFAEPYDKGTILKDEELKANFMAGASQLERFRRGELTTSEAFDVKLLARFHAIIDLVGGYHSLDWSDVKYFYNSQTQKIEPVGYESFSIRKTESIAGQQVPEKFNGIESDLHARIFADPIFFAIYIQELERIASEAYLHAFKSKIQENLNEKLGFLGHEFAYIKFDWKPYYDNVELIRHNLSLPKAVHPFLDSYSDSLITLSVAPVSDFPIEVVSLEINGKRFVQPIAKTVLPAKERNTFTQYYSIQFPNNGKKVKDLVLNCKIPGSQNVFKVVVAEYPFYDYLNENKDSTSSLLRHDPILKKNNLYIDENVIIEENNSVSWTGIDTIFFANNAAIINRGKLSILGYEDQPIVICANKNRPLTNESSLIINLSGNLIFENILFELDDLSGISSNLGEVSIHQCEVIGNGTFLKGSNSNFTVSSVFAADLNQFAILENCVFNGKEIHAANGNISFSSNGGFLGLMSCSFHNFETFAELTNGNEFKSWNTAYENCKSLAILNDASTARLIGGKIMRSELAFNLDQKSTFHFPSNYSLYKTHQEKIVKIDNHN